MTTWSQVSKPSDVWTVVDKTARGSAPDGFLVDGTTDGFFAKTGDGFFTSDGTWTPVGVRYTTWATISKPT